MEKGKETKTTFCNYSEERGVTLAEYYVKMKDMCSK